MSRVTMYLKDRHVPFEVLPHRRAVSSNQEARVLGVDADTVVKTVVVVTADGHWLAAIPASCRLDLRLVRDALGDDSVRLASEGELLVAFPRYELGALPPLGGLLGVPVLVDPRVLRHETVVSRLYLPRPRHPGPSGNGIEGQGASDIHGRQACR